jgi:4-amino-4-deoxy-L-arabinose transferase-like glycosyltransferase
MNLFFVEFMKKGSRPALNRETKHSGFNSLRRCVSLWFVLRVVSVVVVWVAFYLKPRTPGIMVVTSLSRFLFEPWYRWDVLYYAEIVSRGYQPGAPTTNFHPLYPWISAIVAVIFREPVLSLLVVASLAGLFLTIQFYRLAKLDLDDQQAWQATALMLVWPASVALFLPYTEPLFLLLSVHCFYLARQRKFWLAGLFGALATLTRQQGLFLALPLAWEIWEAAERRWSNAFRKSLPLLLMPAAYGLWVLYRAVAVNDVHPDFSSLQKFLHSVMISPSSYQITDQHAFLPPWLTIWRATKVFWRGGVSGDGYIDLSLSIAFIGLFILSWRHLRASYRVYCVAIFLVALSFYAGDINPLLALPRHLVLAFPVFIGLAARYRLRTLPLVLVLIVLTICQFSLLRFFVWQSWIP